MELYIIFLLKISCIQDPPGCAERYFLHVALKGSTVNYYFHNFIPRGPFLSKFQNVTETGIRNPEGYAALYV